MQILINNQPFLLGQRLPKVITSCEFRLSPMIRFTKVPLNQIPIIKQWFNTLIDNSNCEYFIINNTFYRVDELHKFTDV